MNDDFSHIETALGVGATGETEPVVCLPIPVVKIQTPALTDEYLTRDLKHDYETVRKNLRELVEMGKNALDGVLAVAQEGDSPRAYEVAAQMIKTLSDTNKDLLEMHGRINTIRKTEVVNNSTTNNSIYVGSTRDLQDIINSSRSTQKVFLDADETKSE